MGKLVSIVTSRITMTSVVIEFFLQLTVQILWEEFRQTQPDGYGYSRFCELYQRWHRDRSVVMRQEHIPGEKMFVD